MKKVLKATGITVGILFAILLVLSGVIYMISQQHWPSASNLTPAGPLVAWSEAEFFNVMREGITPDGRQLEAEYMPYQIFGYMTDQELHALFAYLKTIPTYQTGIRE